QPDGRGLFLVNLLATQWGTTHQGDRKAVWFSLDHTARVTPRAGTDQLVAAFAELLAVTARPANAPVLCRALLQTLARVAPMRDAVVRVDRADGTGPALVAQLNTAHPADGAPIRIPLGLGSPWSGELEVYGSDDDVTRTLAAVAAERMTGALEAQRFH